MTKLRQAIKKMLRTKKGVPFKDFEETAGKIQHAAVGIPGGRGLFTPINMRLGHRTKFVKIKKRLPLHAALTDWRALLLEATKEPTKAQELVMGVG